MYIYRLPCTGGYYPEGSDFVPNAMPGVVQEPPLEEHLAQVQGWPARVLDHDVVSPAWVLSLTELRSPNRDATVHSFMYFLSSLSLCKVLRLRAD